MVILEYLCDRLPAVLSAHVTLFLCFNGLQVDITGGPQQIVAARHALGERIDEWRATNNPSSAPEEIEYSIKVTRGCLPAFPPSLNQIRKDLRIRQMLLGCSLFEVVSWTGKTGGLGACRWATVKSTSW